MLLELKRNPIDWFGHVKFVSKMVAALLLMVLAAIWMFTWGADALTSRSNLGVAFGAIFSILLLIGVGAGLWMWGIKFSLVVASRNVNSSGEGSATRTRAR
jgi:hypothetical protein